MIRKNNCDILAVDLGKHSMKISNWIPTPFAGISALSENYVNEDELDIVAGQSYDNTIVNRNEKYFFKSSFAASCIVRAVKKTLVNYNRKTAINIVIGLNNSVLFEEKTNTSLLARTVKEDAFFCENIEQIGEIYFQSSQSGILYDEYLNNSGYVSPVCFKNGSIETIVDIGFLTIGITTFEKVGKKINQTFHDSIPSGLHHVVNQLKIILKLKFDLNVTQDAETVDILKTKTAIVGGERTDVSELIDLIIGRSAEKLIKGLPDLCFHRKNRVQLSGSGAPLFFNKLKTQLGNLQMSRDPCHAASSGLLKLATFEPRLLIKPH